MSINILWTDKANLEQKNTIYYNAAKKLFIIYVFAKQR